MNSSNRVISGIFVVQFIVWIQRSTRKVIRFLWMAIAGFLIGWGINQVWSVLPDPRVWMFIVLLLGFPNLVGIVFSWPRRAKLAWHLDRKFELKEQVSTALETIKGNRSNVILESLILDTNELVRKLPVRLLLRGWFLIRELEALLIVLILLGAVSWFTNVSFPSMADIPRRTIPQLGTDPEAASIFPSGIKGLEPINNEQNSSTDGENLKQSGIELSKEQFQTLMSAISEMGKKLSDNPLTTDLGNAALQGDLEKMALEFDSLADQIADFSDESKKNLEDVFRDAANRLDEASIEPLSGDMSDVVASLNVSMTLNNQVESVGVGEGLTQIAEDLRDISNQFGSSGEPTSEGLTQSTEAESMGTEMDIPSTSLTEGGAGIGTSERSEGVAEPIERIAGEGDTIELENTGDNSAILQAGRPSNRDRTTITISGTSEMIIINQSTGSNSVLAPYDYPWKWRDVVATYFSR
ncbi:MAG: hypothetical protein A2Z14_18275 [Chloroflexi bacterium RBG_16_48_8]|nr:MAG: hypothetical protein A2Z14_18275 [Chloroflexi bacterium RBG_16_48_8]